MVVLDRLDPEDVEGRPVLVHQCLDEEVVNQLGQTVGGVQIIF